MSTRYEDLVEEGLDAVVSGRIDVEEFLAAHLEEADELRAVLEAAVAIDRAVDVEPRSTFRYVARANFADRIQARARRSWFSGLTLALRPVGVGLFAVMLATSLAAGGAVAASTDVTPDNLLYGVKLAQESLRIAIARDELDRAGLQARFAERRVEELGRVAQAEDPTAEQRAYLAQQLAANLQAIARTVQGEREQGNISPETRAKLARLAGQLQASRLGDPELLGRVLAQTPPEHRPLIMRLIRQAQEENQRALKSLDAPDQSASDPDSVLIQRPAVPQSTPGPSASDLRATPGQRLPGDLPAAARRTPGALPPPGGSLSGERPTPGPRALGTRPALEQTGLGGPQTSDAVETAGGPAPDLVEMPPAQPSPTPVTTDAGLASGQTVPDAQLTPDPMVGTLARTRRRRGRDRRRARLREPPGCRIAPRLNCELRPFLRRRRSERRSIDCPRSLLPRWWLASRPPSLETEEVDPPCCW